MTPDKVIARHAFRKWAITHQRAKGYGARCSDDEMIKLDPSTGKFVGEFELAFEAWSAARADKQEQCAKVCAARDMGDGSREDQESRRCESAIRALKD